MRPRRLLPCVLTIAFVASCSSVALAHKPSDSYLKLKGGGPRLLLLWDIALKDLEFAIGIDTNQNGEITWGEVKNHRNSIAAHALSHLIIKDPTTGNEEAPIELTLDDLLITQHSDGAYAVLKLEADCAGDIDELEIEYSLLFELDPTHRGLVLYENGPIASTHVLSPDSPTLILHTKELSLWKAFVEYVREGVWHIWIGLDHILFLVTLLLPAVFARISDDGGETWQPVEKFRPVSKSVLKVVTMFTLAHSITLWLATMQYITLPSRLVEATIALSIIVTACNNLYPVLKLSGSAIAFGFGLIHGFGFANVLLDLGLSDVHLAVSLFGFNVGVELGQLAIVMVFLPIAFTLRSSSFYRFGILRLGSVCIASIAAIWVYERLFDTLLLGV